MDGLLRLSGRRDLIDEAFMSFIHRASYPAAIGAPHTPPRGLVWGESMFAGASRPSGFKGLAGREVSEEGGRRKRGAGAGFSYL